MKNTINGYAAAPPVNKPPVPATAQGINTFVPSMKASAQGSLQHKRAHMHKDKARNK